jgi:hypothetical protein
MGMISLKADKITGRISIVLSLKRARQGKTKGSAAYFFGFETKLLQLDDDAFSLIALDFNFTIFHCTAGATL